VCGFAWKTTAWKAVLFSDEDPGSVSGQSGREGLGEASEEFHVRPGEAHSQGHGPQTASICLPALETLPSLPSPAIQAGAITFPSLRFLMP
jgi:hypothetical protein